MTGNKHQLGQRHTGKDPKEVVCDELRGWIERVIVPILVEQYLQEKGLKREQTDG